LDGAVATLIGGVAIAVITYIISPWVKARLEKQRENDPAQGWQRAVKNLEDRVDALEEENAKLEGELAEVKMQLDDKTGIILRQEKVIADQGRMIDARDRYMARVRRIWKDRMPDEEFPPPLPAYAYWLNHSSENGRNRDD
jgi:predicted RNase H-like nuclease (RuvC/YqgF family)